jgi:hypothetical protein
VDSKTLTASNGAAGAAVAAAGAADGTATAGAADGATNGNASVVTGVNNGHHYQAIQRQV